MSHPSVQPHLLIVIHSLGGGGAERVAADLSAYWVQRGYRVTVVTQADASTDAYSLHTKVKRHVLGTASASTGGLSGVLSNIRRVLRLRRLIRRERPTVVLGMMTTSSILAIIAARGVPCRVIATEHTHPPSQALSDMWLRLRRWAYPQATAVVALTSGTAQWLSQHVPGSKLTVIPNAVRWPLESMEPTIEPPPRQGRYRVLAVGRLHPHKGFDLLVRAFEEIADHFPNWDLVILGEGEGRDELQAQIDEAGLSGRISMPGRAGNVADWYVQSDLYVLSSRVEGLSNTLLEAMASGLAPVAYDCETGPREIVRSGIDGVLVSPAEDTEALAAHLSDMMAHPEQREAYARRAVDVRDRFSTTRVMALWSNLFEMR
ncbi:glycosyltransferase family 4 protein [Pollutimonas harenae]|uniref:Glycosyltransferase family 4 protein n=1 Tax=Pollutimonas harenae TaxID=657015 RepID=A0A853GUP1_9BURK|nr:glycosyltransferase family 4 protein [Pollutimonas harenae]NYT86898.1 glycosyltransferase family 4 protein [Pollutimonas harenae]TEA69387.1 glycosyltransferase family 4 protein [Pollutimonas harenae]